MPSVNALAWPIAQRLIAEAGEHRLDVQRDVTGALIVDAGIAATGGIEAGLGIARVCMGGLGRVEVRSDAAQAWPTWIDVRSSHPVLACLASQYAGWSLTASKEETGDRKFFALGSGPARALACREPLFAELGYRDRCAHACLVLEVDRAPPEAVVRKVLRDCAIDPADLAIFVTPTSSLAGTTQVVARVLEVALHKAHVLGFSLEAIVDGSGAAPLPPAIADPVEAMGRTNDAILYGGRVHLSVRGDDDAAARLAQALPSRNSRDYGRPFAQIFTGYEFDFYRIDPALFAPAEAWVSNVSTGRTWHAGAVDVALLASLWQQEAPR